jgi:agmatine deiminase
VKSLQFFLAAILGILFLFIACKKDEKLVSEPETVSEDQASDRTATYTMPDEGQTHEGTWLQWPHQYEYGVTYRNRLDATWVAMTKELVTSEKVHIIAYNTTEKNRIINKLTTGGVSLANVDFRIFTTNDVWVRDNGPIFVRNTSNQLVIEDWGFNGWGYKYGYTKCNIIPNSVGTAIGSTVVNLNSTLKVEGGGYEIDGAGVFMATKSCILNSNRNPGKTQAQVEAIFADKLGVTKFIWLTGVPGLEVTDMHIDGFAKFANANTIVTMNNDDLLYWDVPQADIDILYAAKKVNNTPYNFVNLPLTQNNVVTAYGKNLGYKGSYVNYYIANTKILVPFYSDPNDLVAKNILQSLYPGKTVVGIDCRNLYENGGMVHCVTQQQPL